jgi:uncharacterized protein (TIGR02453 family)
MDLSENNNRDWFTANKLRYDEARADFEDFIFKLTLEILKFDKSISIIDPKKTIFRIYRDVRFSKNKEPYKTNFGAHIHPGDNQAVHSVAGYYIHLEPNGKSMLGGGAYMPPSPWIKAIRQEIDMNGQTLKDILANPEFKTYFNLDGDKLQRPPQGFDASHEHIDLLKYKSLVAVQNLTDDQVLSTNFLEHCSNAFKALYPFNQFLNSSMA